MIRSKFVIRTVGLIGSGNVGSSLARLAVAAGLDAVLSNSRGRDSLADLIADLGDQARAASPAEAAESADIVVVAVPLSAYTRLPVDALTGKTVIDAMNYLPERFGPWKSVYNRFNRWAKKGVWLRMFEALAERSPQSLQLIDSSIVRAHQHAAGGKKGARITPLAVLVAD